MSKKIFIKNFREGDNIFEEALAVKAFSQKVAKNNSVFYDILLSDRSGEISAKVWENDIPNCDKVAPGDVVKVDGVVNTHNNRLGLKITKMKKTDNYDLADIQRSSENDPQKMWDDIEKAIKEIKNSHIKNLLKNIFNEDTKKKFINAPASFIVHHDYRGGLLEHTWEMLNMASRIKQVFPQINTDLVNCGIILHDIGKIEEFELNNTTVHSERGKLLGHIFMGAELILKKKPKEMPENLMNEILHIILSHHGELEFGSPIVPMTVEALAVHTLDLASTKIRIAYSNVHNTLEQEKFTSYVPHLKTELYRSPYIDKRLDLDLPF